MQKCNKKKNKREKIENMNPEIRIYENIEKMLLLLVLTITLVEAFSA